MFVENCVFRLLSTQQVKDWKTATHLRRRGGVRAIVHVQMVVAVELQHLEVQHEPLQDAVRLEGDGAVQVALVAGPEHAAVHLAVLPLEEVVLA